ncbi:DMT family transporter [Gordonia sp. NPDC003376]
MRSNALSARLLVPTVVLYGAGYPLGSSTVAIMSPRLVVLLRFALSALILWVIVAIRHPKRPSRRTVIHAVIAGVLTQAVQFLSLYWALANGVSPGLASLIVALNPVVTALIMSVTLGHRESPAGAVALVLGVAAVVLACTPKLLADHSIGIPVAAVVVAMLGLCYGGIHQGRYCADVDPWTVTAIGVTASTPIAAVLTLTGPAECSDWPRAIVLIVVMTVLTSVGATTLYAACIRRAGARAASILFAVIPAAASVMAWVGLGETLSPYAIGGLLLGAAACIVQSRTPAPRPEPTLLARNTTRGSATDA